ncbi:uncharacterized protein N0V89_000399 [Didymosphaeria variabile]|uniref:Zn(2)-C6 fungal-type domain-containing protein n=1 Tax=Didymosphaeria variabile TaxID=1932322 RepID=A0A9W8XV25_9PLEO|nr:uncharacterized protein N0V89_000399 [Didymosphaeria variabile]KAJ4359843.1 hypothetical protein N0V89_000399 [Didymosphaeria variabile]
MASTAPYGDAEEKQGGSSNMFVNQNGGTPPQQQQPQHIPTDPELQLREQLQMHQGNDMMHQAPHLQQMGATNAMHHHFQTPPRPVHSPQHMAQSAQSVMGIDDHNAFVDHDGATRKRSKVSRACDECRRKKIRCDATSENGPESCSSCKRTGARCQFSRQPMKRGPSKGYIKELADRLNSLENQIQQPQAQPANYDFVPIDQGLDAPSQFSRKRTYSMSENFGEPYSRPSWSGQDRGTYITEDPSALPLLTREEQPLNGANDSNNNNRRVSFTEWTLVGSLITGSNEAIIKASLPPSETSVNEMLHHCFDVVDAAKYTLDDSDHARQFFNNLVYCQSLVLLFIASDRPKPGTVGNSAELLGRIAGVVTEIGLDDAKTLASLREQDLELYQAARQTFWVAFTLDRFHASSRSKNLMLPIHEGSPSREDHKLLGEEAYHLVRAADIAGQVASISRAGNVPELDPASPFAFAALSVTSPATKYLNGQLSRFRESIEISNLPSNASPYLAYQYLRVFVTRLSNYSSSVELFSLTKDLLRNLANPRVTPLHHIFASLVATTLGDLSDRLETQIEAHAAMKEMADGLANEHIINASSDNLGWDAAIRDLLHQKKGPNPSHSAPEQTSPSQHLAGLQHLAAAAVGEREGADARPASSGNAISASTPSKFDNDVSAAIAAANEAAKAQAQAQDNAPVAQQRVQSPATGGNGNSYETNSLVKDDAF